MVIKNYMHANNCCGKITAIPFISLALPKSVTACCTGDAVGLVVGETFVMLIVMTPTDKPVAWLSTDEKFPLVTDLSNFVMRA